MQKLFPVFNTNSLLKVYNTRGKTTQKSPKDHIKWSFDVFESHSCPKTPKKVFAIIIYQSKCKTIVSTSSSATANLAKQRNCTTWLELRRKWDTKQKVLSVCSGLCHSQSQSVLTHQVASHYSPVINMSQKCEAAKWSVASGNDCLYSFHEFPKDDLLRKNMIANVNTINSVTKKKRGSRRERMPV